MYDLATLRAINERAVERWRQQQTARGAAVVSQLRRDGYTTDSIVMNGAIVGVVAHNEGREGVIVIGDALVETVLALAGWPRLHS